VLGAWYGLRALSLNPLRRLTAPAVILLAVAAGGLAACGGDSADSTAPSPSPSPTTASTVKAPCTVEAAMAAVKLVYNKAVTQAGVPPGGSDLHCAAGVARIAVLIGPVNPAPNGPQGTPHLALLEDHAGTWVVANDKLCGSNGQPLKAIPATLGQVCGVQ
jgi:hypothetical protein